MTYQSPSGPADALPAAYAKFLPVLERLSDPLQRMLRGQLLQFERNFRLKDHDQPAEKGEFEGLGGLTTRGDVSHIVHSELLLRTQVPLEFLRRLAESETLFHEKRYADPGARHIYRVMISCGPGLLGHGRILALAALFFIARVAHQRGASFHWCVLPRADGPVWFDEVSVNTVKRFLRAASFREMTMEDCAEAEAARATFAGEPEIGVRISDWVIGSQPPVRSTRRGNAVAVATAHASNAFGFVLAAPVLGQPRSAQMLLRQDGWDRSRVTMAFPDDRVCVSALANPFQPFRPAAAGPGQAAAISVRAGWEPQHLMIAHTQNKIVRLRDGVLILVSGKHDHARNWFVPLPPDVVLAGIRIDRDLMLLLYSRDDDGDLLSCYSFSLPAKRDPVALVRRLKRSTTAQLFKNRSAHAIPVLTGGGSNPLEFYAVSGRPFHLLFDDERQAVELVCLHNEPAVLLATGAHRIVKDKSGGRPVLRALRGNRAHADEFAVPDDLPDHLHGLVYSSSERGMAYSLSAGHWIVPGVPGESADRTILLSTGETLLSARWQGDSVAARIWSDARYGGDGTVRTVRRDCTGHEVSRRLLLKLGVDALSIASIQFADDGLWSVVVDEEGFPATLLRHRFNKRNSCYDEQRHDVAELKRSALVVDLAEFRG